jgi:hypothetical protein
MIAQAIKGFGGNIAQTAAAAAPAAEEKADRIYRESLRK